MQKICRTCQKVFGPSERICPEHQGYLLLHSLVGDVLRGRYEVTETIGTGQHSFTCRGHDRELGYDVAIKALLLDPDGYRFAFERFEREAATYAALSDPRFPRVFTRGQLLDGRPYFVFEYIDGESLDDLLKKEVRLLTPRAVRIACEVAAAMEQAHKAGFIHQDITPGNILRYQDATATEQIKIIDFGIVRMTLERLGANRKLRRPVGNPPYMSTEQWRRDDVDHRTDIYSLGVTLYEMLTGAPPFGDDDWEDVRRRALHDPVPSMREAISGPSLPLQLPDGLERLVYRMLEKSRDNRPDSMLEVYQRLRALLKELEPDAMPYARFFSYLDPPVPGGATTAHPANDDELAGPQDALLAQILPETDREPQFLARVTPSFRVRDMWSEADVPIPVDRVAEMLRGNPAPDESVVEALAIDDEGSWSACPVATAPLPEVEPTADASPDDEPAPPEVPAGASADPTPVVAMWLRDDGTWSLEEVGPSAEELEDATFDEDEPDEIELTDHRVDESATPEGDDWDVQVLDLGEAETDPGHGARLQDDAVPVGPHEEVTLPPVDDEDAPAPVLMRPVPTEEPDAPPELRRAPLAPPVVVREELEDGGPVRAVPVAPNEPSDVTSVPDISISSHDQATSPAGRWLFRDHSLGVTAIVSVAAIACGMLVAWLIAEPNQGADKQTPRARGLAAHAATLSPPPMVAATTAPDPVIALPAIRLLPRRASDEVAESATGRRDPAPAPTPTPGITPRGRPASSTPPTAAHGTVEPDAPPNGVAAQRASSAAGSSTTRTVGSGTSSAARVSPPVKKPGAVLRPPHAGERPRGAGPSTARKGTAPPARDETVTGGAGSQELPREVDRRFLMDF